MLFYQTQLCTYNMAPFLFCHLKKIYYSLVASIRFLFQFTLLLVFHIRIYIKLQMIQQNQQKKLRVQSFKNIKEKNKIGFLTKKCMLPPINFKSVSKQKKNINPEVISSRKKGKLPQIFYEQENEEDTQIFISHNNSRQNQIIQEQHIRSFQQKEKQQTVLKRFPKNQHLQKNQNHLCHYHQKKVISRLERENLQKQIQNHFHQLVDNNQHKKCCITEPSDQNSQSQSRVNYLMNHHRSLNQYQKKGLNSNQQKLRPIKLNSYQKAQFFDPMPDKHFISSISPKFKDFLTPKETKFIVQKLNKPKCHLGCGKRNCQCYKQIFQYNQESIQNSRFLYQRFQKSNTHNKLKVNISRLEEINNSRNQQKNRVNQIKIQRNRVIQDDSSLRKKIKQNKAMKRHIKLKPLSHKTQEAFSQDQNTKQYFESQVLQRKYPQKKTKIAKTQSISHDDSFIKGIITPSKTTIQRQNMMKQEIQIQKRYDKMVEIEIQTQDILIVRDQQQEKDSIPNKIKQFNAVKDLDKNSKFLTIQQNQVQDLNKSQRKTSQFKTIESQCNTTILPLIDQNNPQKQLVKDTNDLNRKPQFSSIRAINFTFAIKDPNSNNINNQNINLKDHTKNYSKISKSQTKKITLNMLRQYWLAYDINNQRFIDFDNGQSCLYQKALQVKKQMKIINEILNEKIQSQYEPNNAKNGNSSKNNKFNKNQNSKFVSNNEEQIQKSRNYQKQIEDLCNIPITIEINKSKKGEISQVGNQILTKYRNCISSKSGKKSVNMFNRTQKTIKQSRIKKCYKLPKEQQYVQYVKNYQPINPQIQIQTLIKSSNFKVLPTMTKFYFGKTIGECVRHGIGIEITFTQIFQGQYKDGLRKKGYLKTHQGIYQGTFQNNLRHGKGTFKWQNGETFDGQWKMGTKNGFGIWKSPDGSIYQGEWLLNLQHGKGKFIHPTSTYQGYFKNFLKQGNGQQIFSNGDKFIGQYRQGKPNGKGKYFWTDGTYYEGQFADGLRHGYGKWHQSPESLYEGQFVSDQKNGKGIQYYKDGSYFEGQFSNGQILNGKFYDSKKQISKVVNFQQ